MSNKNILDFVAAIATGQTAPAVEFAKAELQSRVQTQVESFKTDYQYKVAGDVTVDDS